jgi:hypothetical protein
MIRVTLTVLGQYLSQPLDVNILQLSTRVSVGHELVCAHSWLLLKPTKGEDLLQYDHLTFVSMSNTDIPLPSMHELLQRFPAPSTSHSRRDEFTIPPRRPSAGWLQRGGWIGMLPSLFIENVH